MTVGGLWLNNTHLEQDQNHWMRMKMSLDVLHLIQTWMKMFSVVNIISEIVKLELYAVVSSFPADFAMIKLVTTPWTGDLSSILFLVFLNSSRSISIRLCMCIKVCHGMFGSSLLASLSTKTHNMLIDGGKALQSYHKVLQSNIMGSIPICTTLGAHDLCLSFMKKWYYATTMYIYKCLQKMQ